MHECGTESYAFRWSIHAIARLVLLLLQSEYAVWSNNSCSLVPWLRCISPFVSVAKSQLLSKCLEILLAMIPEISFDVDVRHVIGL